MGFAVDTPERPRNRRTALLLIPLTLLFLAVVVVFHVVYTYAQVVGSSMLPTLLDGDRVLITKEYVIPRRGDIVSIRTSMQGRFSVIKRVVAIAGDTVAVTDGRATVNGSPEAATYVVPQPLVGSLTPVTVPEGSVYVLGDNRPGSEDSRVWGPVRLEEITGQVLFVVYPLGRFGRLEAPPG